MNDEVVPGSDYVTAVAQVDVQFVVRGRALRCHQQGISQVPGIKKQNLCNGIIQLLVQKYKFEIDLCFINNLGDNVWCAQERIQHVEGP